MKTKHVRERSPFKKYRPNVVEIETTQDERRILDAAHLASDTLRRTFDNWVTMGRGLQLLRKKADLLGTRNAFNDLRDQHGLGNRFFNKTQVSKLLRAMENLEAVEKWRATLTEKDRIRWASPDAIIRHCPVFNPPPAADAARKPSAYAKLEQTNDDLARELDAAKAHIAELEAAQPDQGSLFNLDLKNDKPDIIAEAIIGNVDLGRAEKIARAILKAVKAKSQKPGPDHAVDSDHHLSNQRPTARGPVTSPAAASTTAASRCGRTR
jgi:hypothetical protein